MIRQPGKTFAPGSFEDWAFLNAQQKIQILDAEPTAAEPLLSEGNRGYFNSKIYEVIGGVLYETSVTPTA